MLIILGIILYIVLGLIFATIAYLRRDLGPNPILREFIITVCIWPGYVCHLFMRE